MSEKSRFATIGAIIAMAASAFVVTAAESNDPAPASHGAEAIAPVAPEPSTTAEPVDTTEAVAPAVFPDEDNSVTTAAEPTPADEQPGVPVPDEAAAAPAPTPEEVAPPTKEEPAAPVVAEQTPAEAEPAPPPARSVPENTGPAGRRIIINGDLNVEAGERLDGAVTLGGSLNVAGTVRGNARSIVGSVVVSGEVEGDVCAIVGDAVIDGTVRGSVTSVLGKVILGPRANVAGRVRAAGGVVASSPGAVVALGVEEIAWTGSIPGMDDAKLKAWVDAALARGRLLAPNATTPWAWWFAGAILLVYAVVALVFRTGVDRCVSVVHARPGYVVATGVLTLVLASLLAAVVGLTTFGRIFVPALGLILLLAGTFGRVSILACIGRRMAAFFGSGQLHAAAGVLLGGILVAALYLAPVGGLLVWAIIEVLGIGAAVSTLLLAIEKPSPLSDTEEADQGDRVAGFWRRLAASFVDALLVGILTWLTGIWATFFVWFVVYCAALWSWKQTTVGGAICGVKLVRIDGSDVRGFAAVVRALAGFLSLAVFALGFFWAAIDRRGQSWHDKVAGTTIVRKSRGASLA